MSFGIYLRGLKATIELLRWCAQPQYAYEWQPEDRFFVRRMETRDGRQKKTEYEVVIWLPQVDAADRRFRQLLSLVDDKHKTQLSKLPALEDCWEMSFVELLQRFPVSPQRRRRRLRQNLLVALYGGERSDLAEVLASVPKNPEQKTAVLFLDEREHLSPHVPRYLIRLPQADPQVHWSIWLETENRKLKSRDSYLKLFARLGEGSSAEFFVEHGWTHPVPEIVDLYPNEQGANPILIEGQGANGVQTRWIPVVSDPADTQVEFQSWDDAAVPVDLQLDREPQLLLNFRPQTSVPLKMTLQLAELSRERREGLRGIEARIRVAQKLLFQLEQQRSALSGQQQTRFRLLLMFAQPRAVAGQTPALADDFQRFLLISRRQLDKLDYVFLETDEDHDYHVVVTREPTFWQDLHSALASDVFVQPVHWAQWPIRHVFVRHGFLLEPGIDDPSLADGLARLMAERGGTGDKLVLIDGAQSEAPNQLRLMILPQATSGGLAAQLGFLNRDYPVAELQARGEVREELVAALKKCQVDLDEEVQHIEHTLKEQAALRLDRVHHAWNEVAPRIDRSARHLEQCQDRYQDFAQIMGEFATTWRDFLDRALTFQAQLIKEKLEVLAQLEREESEWHQAVEATKKANIEVVAILPPIQVKIEKALAEARLLHASAVAAFQLYKAQADAAARELDGLCEAADRLERQARQTHERVLAKERDYQEREKAISALRAELADFQQRLTNHRNALQAHLSALEQEVTRAGESRDELTKAFKTAGARIKEWQTAVAAGATVSKTVEDAYQTARKEIQSLQKSQRSQVEQAQKMVESAQQAIEAIEARIAATANERQEVDAEIVRLRDEIARLDHEQAHLLKDQQALATAGQTREQKLELVRQAAARLGAVITSVRAEGDQQFQHLLGDWQQVAATLDRLGELEISLEPLESFRTAVGLRANSSSIYHRFRTLAGGQGGDELWAQLIEADIKKG